MKSYDEEKCAWFRDRVDLYIDGDLAGEELERFEAHIDGCAACRGELELARQVVDGLRSLPGLACPDSVLDEAAGRIDVKQPAAGRNRLREWLAGVRILTLRPALAAMTLVVVVAAVYMVSHEGLMLPDDPDSTQQLTAVEMTPQEVEAARQDVALAFAYVSKYSRKAGVIVKNDVIDERVVPTVRKAMDRNAASNHQ